MNVIEIEGLTKKYKDFTLSNISLELPKGCVMGLIGENGAGKSTLIRSMLGITHYDEGSINVFGKEPSAELHDKIGVVLDEPGIPECFTIKDINAVMKATFSKWDEKQFFDYIKRFELPSKKKFKDFSKGMKMKTCIACALSHNAELLILDEPTSGLDPLVRDEIIDIFNDFTRDENHSILISSHIVSDLEKICDYIAFIHKGRLTLCEEKDILLEQYAFVNLTNEQLSRIDSSAVIGKKANPYGVQAIVDRFKVPKDLETRGIAIEELFLFMSREER